MYKLLITLLVILALYVLSVRGRRGHPVLPALQNWYYAHRGLHGNGCPENSMAAFRKALESGYGIELDVHLLADGNLAVIHDSALKRTTGLDGTIEALRTEDLTNCCLEGTEETVPEFRQVLDLFNGKAPLIIELKVAGGNYAQLCQKVCNMMDGYQGVYCMESFDPRCVYWLKQNRPDIVRGQLTENYFQSQNKLNPILKFLLTHQMLNWLTLPDFVAYRYQDCKTFSNWVARSVWKIQGVTWTLRSKADFNDAVSEGWIPIFENFTP